MLMNPTTLRSHRTAARSCSRSPAIILWAVRETLRGSSRLVLP